MVGSSTHTGASSARERAARIASSTDQRMLASTISGKSGPRWRRMAPTRSTSSRSDGRPTFILIARKGQVLVGLAQERVEREVEVDAAGVARHARIEAAQHAPERRALAPRAKI